MIDLQIDADQVETLKTAFDLIEPRGEEFTAAFYGHFLGNYPEVRVVFASVDMDRQHKKLFKALKMIVGGLKNPGELATYLSMLGDKHRDVYVVESQDYFMFKRALLDTFAEFLDERWTEEMKVAWAIAFDKISARMRDRG
jgi:hemoglobin-like flavoprotein